MKNEYVMKTIEGDGSDINPTLFISGESPSFDGWMFAYEEDMTLKDIAINAATFALEQCVRYDFERGRRIDDSDCWGSDLVWCWGEVLWRPEVEGAPAPEDVFDIDIRTGGNVSYSGFMVTARYNLRRIILNDMEQGGAHGPYYERALELQKQLRTLADELEPFLQEARDENKTK